MATYTFTFGKKEVIVENLPALYKQIVRNEVITFGDNKIVADSVRVEVQKNNVPVAILYWKGSYQVENSKVTIKFKK